MKLKSDQWGVVYPEKYENKEFWDKEIVKKSEKDGKT